MSCLREVEMNEQGDGREKEPDQRREVLLIGGTFGG